MTSKRKTLANEKKTLKALNQDIQRLSNETKMIVWLPTPWLVSKEARYVRRHP